MRIVTDNPCRRIIRLEVNASSIKTGRTVRLTVSLSNSSSRIYTERRCTSREKRARGKGMGTCQIHLAADFKMATIAQFVKFLFSFFFFCKKEKLSKKEYTLYTDGVTEQQIFVSRES